MSLQNLFQPVPVENFEPGGGYHPEEWGANIDIHYTGKSILSAKKKIALIGIKPPKLTIEDPSPADKVRAYLYKMKNSELASNVIDCGDIITEGDPENDNTKISYIIQEVINEQMLPVIIGKNHSLAFAQYMAYEKSGKTVNLVDIDSRIDFNIKSVEALHDHNYLQKIFFSNNTKVFNYSNIGYQSYFLSREAERFLEKLFFDIYRVGIARESLTEMEPIIRNSDMLTIDLNSVRQGDAPAAIDPSPNGFYGEEICALSRFAGLSDHLSSFGIYGFDHEKDINEQSLHLIAQMIWYFVEGYSSRKPEDPSAKPGSFLKFITSLKDHSYEIIFFKSKSTNRWWMEIPVPQNNKYKVSNYLVPCSYQDYVTACNDEIPDRWWQALQKLT